MLDATELEKRGVPTVTMATNWFVKAAKAQAGMAGVPELRIVGLDYVSKGQGHWLSREQREALIDRNWGEILGALTGESTAQSVPPPHPA